MNLKEVEKNMIVCAVVILAAGVGLFITGKTVWAVISVVSAVIFAIIAVCMIAKRRKNEDSDK